LHFFPSSTTSTWGEEKIPLPDLHKFQNHEP
jgi:hypothetical protein